jgi:hypothetical protein
MKQYLEEEKNIWNIELVTKVPLYSSRKEFNFRIKSVEKINGEIINDPALYSSKYIFSINKNMLGKSMYFNFKFSVEDISDVKSFTFGFCDEMVRWLPKTLFTYENEFLKIKNTEILEEVEEESSEVIPKIIFEETVMINNNFEQILFTDEQKSDISTIELIDKTIAEEISMKKDSEVKPTDVSKVNLLEKKKYNKKSKTKSKI